MNHNEGSLLRFGVCLLFIAVFTACEKGLDQTSDEAQRDLVGSVAVFNGENNREFISFYCEEAFPEDCEYGIVPYNDQEAMARIRDGFKLEYSGDACTQGFMGRAYEDIDQGAQVIVRNGTGAVIATGSLGPGTYRIDTTMTGAYCSYPFVVSNVPRVEFYEIEVSHRDGPLYSASELDSIDWQIELSIGDPS